MILIHICFNIKIKVVLSYFDLPFKTPIQRHIETIRLANDTIHPTIGIDIAISNAIFVGGGEKYFKKIM